jgi:hypothetical protein
MAIAIAATSATTVAALSVSARLITPNRSHGTNTM